MELKDITPEHMKCGPFNCPSVFETEEGDLVIIGKKPETAILKKIEGKVGPDEVAIVIDPALLANLAVW